MTNKKTACKQVFLSPQNFHPSCFEDYKKNVSTPEPRPPVSDRSSSSLCSLSPQTSSFLDVTPSPSKLLTDHPLGAFVKAEEQEESTSCAAAASATQEEQSESGEPPEVKAEAGSEAAP